MKLSAFLLLFFGAVSFAELPSNIAFQGNVRFDATAPFCRVSSAEIQLSPLENGNQKLNWIEKGRLVESSSIPCEVNYSATLFVTQRNAVEQPVEWALRFENVPNREVGTVTLIEDTYRIRAETTNPDDILDRPYKLEADLFYNSEQRTVSYSRFLKYKSGKIDSVFGVLLPLDHNTK